MLQSDDDMGLDFAAARLVLRRALAEHVSPAAVVDIGTPTEPLWQEAFGKLSYEHDSAPATLDTVFDLASLTKVLATAPLAMRAIENGAWGLDDPVADHVPGWNRRDRIAVTIRDLLSHCSGLPAHRPYFREHRGQVEFTRAICEEPLEYEPRTRAVYSDLGFMLLGFMLAGSDGLASRFTALKAHTSSAEDLQFLPPERWRARTAPTQLDDWRGRLLRGEVDDQNAAALDGVAGHAGLFGTAAGVAAQARHLLQVLDGRIGAYRRETAQLFTSRRTDVGGSSRALAWDTMLATSSCGTRMSARAFGHTGFTGTSLWIDPERAIYVVLLTNRVHGGGTADAIAGVRRAFHDAVIAALDRM
jgi:CubicO group peptidase (beta-lactamase class C family)